MARKVRTAAQIMAALGTSANGVASREELLEAGMSSDEITERLASGALLPKYRGVYRVGHQAPSVEASYLAAVKACGKGALLRGLAAAHLWGLIKGSAPAPEVLTPTERKVKGIRTRRSRKIDRRDATKWRGIPVTTVARTVVDLAAQSTPDELARIVHEAAVRYRVKAPQIEAVLERRPNSPGATTLRTVMRGDARVLLSDLERAFIALLRKENLPLPRTNIPVDGHWVDCRWPEHKLTVELDSYRYHGSRRAWEQDQRRERKARARGDEYRRYVWGDVFEEPHPTTTELRQLLSTLPS